MLATSCYSVQMRACKVA